MYSNILDRGLPKLIGFAGPARSGKDTAAAYFIGHYGYTRLAFADAIKDGLQVMLGITRGQIDGAGKESDIEGYGFSPRAAMQEVGMALRGLNPDVWLQALVNKWEDRCRRPVVVPDVRMENEANWVRRNGILIHIHREIDTPIRAHVSENPLAPGYGDYHLINIGTIADLQRNIAALIERIRE